MIISLKVMMALAMVLITVRMGKIEIVLIVMLVITVMMVTMSIILDP